MEHARWKLAAFAALALSFATPVQAQNCLINAPTSVAVNASFALCAPTGAGYTRAWYGTGLPANNTSSCITIAGLPAGTYEFQLVRSQQGVEVDRCSHVVRVGTVTPTQCNISGMDVITDGGSAYLCATSRANTSYQWSGPGRFASTSRCITVSASGTYTVTLRDRSTGRIDRCTHDLTNTRDPADNPPGNEDPDAVYWDNCPRDLQYWRGALTTSPTVASGLSSADQLALAREIDRRSSYFNWSNDVEGLRSALSPASPVTRRKQIARQYAALLANAAAGDLGLGFGGENAIGLDMDTHIEFGGASTIGELVALTDRWLSENRGNFARLNATLNQVNRGHGIGATCGSSD